MSGATILAADVGGTNSRVAFFRLAVDGSLESLFERTWPSRDHSGLDEILREASAASRLAPSAATIGIAGPVRDGRCETTNLPWIVESRDLARALSLETVGLVNDLEATALGLGELSGTDFEILHAGDHEASGSLALIAAGTGLGEAALIRDGSRLVPLATEGGHATFAPQDELQDAFAQWARERFGHVSFERVLSGPGLVSLVEFLADTGRERMPPALAEALACGGEGAAVTQAAGRGEAIARAALDTFCAVYGAEAGNLALKTLSTGGVFVGGGIAPRILPWLRQGGFMAAFLAKGRMRRLLESMPVRVVLDDRCALKGAARHAARSLRPGGVA